MHLMDDATLVEAARRGDDSAWADIYDRYADRLHDHCYRILRDRDEAADALHDAFLAASRNLQQLRDPARLRPWLYSICRHTSLRRLKARDRVELTDAPDEMSTGDVELDRGARQEELAELVWAAAAGLNGRDQALLDLSVRQGLEGQELADAMGTTLNNSYVMVSRMRDQVERSLGALLIARMGREDCEELDRLLTGWDGKFSPLLRKRVARHVDQCEVCGEKRKTVASPLALLAFAPLIPAPAALKAKVISSIRNVDVFDAPHVRFTKDGYAAPIDLPSPHRRPAAAWLATAVAVLLLLGGFFFAGIGEDDGGTLRTAAGQEEPDTSIGERRRVTTTTLDTDTTDPTDSAADGGEDEEDGSDEEDDDGDGGSSTTATTRPGGSSTTSTSAPGAGTGGGSSTTATTAPARITITDFRLGPRPIFTTRCQQSPTTVVAEAFVTGNPHSVRMVLSRGGIVTMKSVGGGKYTATIGPYADGDADVHVVAQALSGPREVVWTWDADVVVTDCTANPNGSDSGPLTPPQ